MVARDRGAVLRAVAAARVRRRGDQMEAADRCGDARGPRGRRVRRAPRDPVGARTRRARLHGHRREDLRAPAGGGGRGLRRVARWPRPPRAGRAVGAGGGRGHPPGRARDDRAGRARLLRRRCDPRLRRHARDRRALVGRGRWSRGTVDLVVEAARMDRRRLLRRLPLALAGHALAGGPRSRCGGPRAPTGRGCRPHVRPRRALLRARREADPERILPRVPAPASRRSREPCRRAPAPDRGDARGRPDHARGRRRRLARSDAGSRRSRTASPW